MFVNLIYVELKSIEFFLHSRNLQPQFDVLNDMDEGARQRVGHLLIRFPYSMLLPVCSGCEVSEALKKTCRDKAIHKLH